MRADAANSPPVAVLVSGGGRLLQRLLDLNATGRLGCHVQLVISSSDRAPALARAQAAAVRAEVVHQRQPGGAEARDRRIELLLDEVGAQAVALAGYLAWLRVPARLTNRVVNIHPSLLPAFGGQGMWGQHVHEAVLASGACVSGCTAHLVDSQYDHGPILAQRVVPVCRDDTSSDLAARVFRQELRLLPLALGWVAQGRVSVMGQRCRVAPAATQPRSEIA